jgi:hypothetical protein
MFYSTEILPQRLLAMGADVEAPAAGGEGGELVDKASIAWIGISMYARKVFSAQDRIPVA